MKNDFQMFQMSAILIRFVIDFLKIVMRAVRPTINMFVAEIEQLGDAWATPMCSASWEIAHKVTMSRRSHRDSVTLPFVNR